MPGRVIHQFYFMLATLFLCTLLITQVKAQSREDSISSLQADEGRFMASRGGGLQGPEYAYRQLSKILDEEDSLLKMMDSIKTRMEHINLRKRGHVQCLVNLVACYGRRK